MDAFFDGGLTLPTLILLALALGLALGFEFVNGFHDTANAVATVIYTHSLRPMVAVVWSGFWNFLGVLTSSGAVAFGIVALLPVELIVNVGSAAGFAMVFALLVSAILWNLGTWYFGLPASSSHTLIGSILGVGLMNSYMAADRAFGEGVNWGKVQDTAMALLVSPVVGFVCAGLLLLLAKVLIKKPELYRDPPQDKAPPLWIRGLLVLTCTGVSFAHGSNDGQKGMGLIMLILIGIVPATYALDLSVRQETLNAIAVDARAAAGVFERMAEGASRPAPEDASAALSQYLRSGKADPVTFAALASKSAAVASVLEGVAGISDIAPDSRRALRSDLYLVSESIGKLNGAGRFAAADKPKILPLRDKVKTLTTFIPTWVKAAVAIALGLGTMIGWKRIVVTVGEKIGKAHLTYGQGASAELVAMTTIAAADIYGLPVSTTHVLSSGVAGTMAANHSGLQMDTLRNLLLAWVLTLPVCVFLGAALFSGGLYVVLNVLGLQ
ncbi:inorganic phosphate transporter [Telmatospirillum siberiense]|uniref:Phosphate transporter n=1 Tax=Telmatospirillum siberiense TaxID=382514 RepID=A0A2N3Q158_9PROT|nr:inorganic phosphate transporter [Telmatospirillum siberiense]PKU26383.1 anion permease [Telmatospirillum siberiense]